MLDVKTEFGARAQRRLKESVVIWFTTVDRRGTPQPIPVWYLWDGETFLIYSQPDTAKLRNLAANPRVALHLDGNGGGGDIVVALGEAELLPEAKPAHELADYMAKYANHIRRIGYAQPEAFGADYSIAIRVRPTRFRGF